MMPETQREIQFPVMRVEQPIGSFYFGKMTAKDLVDISWFDVRQLSGDDDLDEYLGIQRKVSEKRVREIAQYVELPDATFPSAVILAVQGRCASLESLPEGCGTDFFTMKLRNIPGEHGVGETVLFRGIARVLDGQHRIRGLKDSVIDLNKFEVNVCIFVEADLADQASIFATVNLAQTKVNKSLVFDLLSYSKSRSPDRTCHSVVVALDRSEKSPFHRRIKRLGVATEGRFGEVLTQATVVQALLPYITRDLMKDRLIGKTNKEWGSAGTFDPKVLIFRDWFLNDRDDEIARQIMHYFEAVRRRWPIAWDSVERGNMLPRTNGFKAFMHFLRPCYNMLGSGELVTMKHFLSVFEKVELSDRDFNTERFLPGSAGERALFRTLMQQSGLDGFEDDETLPTL